MERGSGSDQPSFEEGQQVMVTRPPGLAGKKAIVVGPAPGGSLAVRFESGSVFNMLAENLQDAPAPIAAPEDEQLEFTPGQRVMIIWPLPLAGKKGDVVEPVGKSFAVRFKTGSVFHILTENLMDVAELAAGTSRSAASQDQKRGITTGTSRSAASQDQLEMTIQGQRVVVSDAAPEISDATEAEKDQPMFPAGTRVLVSWPPAVAGVQGEIVGPSLPDSFAVRFESGNVFNIQTEELRDASTCCGHSPCCRIAAARIRARKLKAVA